METDSAVRENVCAITAIMAQYVTVPWQIELALRMIRYSTLLDIQIS